VNAEILGISFDTPEENKEFAEAQSFPYRLLSDPDKAVGEAYGAKKGPDEQWPMVAKRLSFLIDPEGRVAKTYEVSDVAAHPEQVLEDIRNLQTQRG
jgi:peroxiredoxin Q/BCP